MSYNRKTFRFLKFEKSSDFARRKNEVEDKMLGTKLKVMEKEERSIRQKLYEIRREKYSRSFYKSPDRSAKFVDVNVCETDEGEKSKPNLITASGVERTKCALRRKSIAVEEFNPGQVVRVCVSSKLEDKVTRDESPSPCALPAIVKAAPKRRYSVAIVTDVSQHNVPDFFAFGASYMQSITEANDETNISKDDFCIDLNYQKKHSDTTLDELREWTADRTDHNIELSACLEKLGDLKLQTKFTEEPSGPHSLNDKEFRCNEKNLCSADSCSSFNVSTSEPEETKTDIDSTTSAPTSPKRKVTYSDAKPIFPSQRPQSSRSYSDSSLQERSIYRKCSTPVLGSSRKHSRAQSVGANNSSVFRLEAESKPRSITFETDKNHKSTMGYKRKPRSVSVRTGPGYQDSALTEKEEKVAEQIMIRQFEIKTAADKMRKLSMQHFGDAKNTMKVPRRQSTSTSPHVQQAGLENARNDANNNTEGNQRPGIVRRNTDNPQVLRKFVKKQCKNEKGKTTMEQVLSELSWDMPDCRYLRCSDQANTASDCNEP